MSRRTTTVPGAMATAPRRPGTAYSGTPLPRKLGMAPGARVAFLDAPETFADVLGELPDGVEVTERLGGAKDLVVVFVTRRAQFERRLGALRRANAPDGMGWGAGPQRAAREPTRKTEGAVRDGPPPTGPGGTKDCAIDD